MILELLLRELSRDEAVRLRPYKDSKGLLTIGIGRCLDRTGISMDEAMYLVRNDIARTMHDLDVHLPWWRGLDEVRQRVIVNMGFNMGVDGVPENPNDGLTGFRETLALIQSGQYEHAAAHMRASLWAKQVGARAERLAKMMETGNEPA